jgi:hypothetical protein
MKAGGSLSIWFFIGISLLVNGALICGAGVYELFYPSPSPGIQMYEYHANVWWGALLFIVGAVYCFYFSPARERARNARSV